mgnify:CR=1 FL=1
MPSGYCVSAIATLQQYLPFTVLKQHPFRCNYISNFVVATVPTVYGIETVEFRMLLLEQSFVATVPTVYGIETAQEMYGSPLSLLPLQQYLPFTVLKLLIINSNKEFNSLIVATVLTVYGMRRRVRDSRGAKRR